MKNSKKLIVSVFVWLLVACFALSTLLPLFSAVAAQYAKASAEAEQLRQEAEKEASSALEGNSDSKEDSDKKTDSDTK